MEINIANLCPSLFNHYGDAGNILSLKWRLEKRGIKANITDCNDLENTDFKNTDILYIGGATEKSIASVYDSMCKIKDKIGDYAQNGGVILAVCTGFEMLGKSFETENSKYDGLGILDITSKKGKKRLIGNIVIRSEELGFDIVGFENHIGRMNLSGNKSLGKVLCGFGNDDSGSVEGVISKNIIGTYIHGPILPKNPSLADYIIETALERKYGKCTLTPLDDEAELKAHNYVKNTYLK